MTASTSRCSTSFLLAASALVGCSGRSTEGVGTSPQPATSAQGSISATATSDSANQRYTRADVDFMSHMIEHHAQALVMAGWAPTHGASPSIRIMAERIVNGQQDEIASMQRWLRDRGQPAPEPARSPSNGARAGETTTHQHGHQDMAMSGILTEAQLKELEAARGRQFDRLFLTYMIQHHRGAVTMVDDLFATPAAARDQTVFKLASDISADQSSEVARMERMLAALPAE